jgi:energy-coupling factor transporter transmembrane protein EcfT
MVKKSGADAPNPADPASMSRIQQIRMVAKIVREGNPRALPLVALAGLGAAAVVIVVGWLLGMIWLFIPLGILLGVLAAIILFGRFATSAQYAAVEGQPGGAAAILQSLRGGFTTTPAIAANRNMDVVHRTVGKPGVILVGEGSPSRLPSLLAAEKKRIARVANQIPIYDFQVGDAEGQVPLRQINKKIMKLPRNLKGQAVAELNFRLNALPTQMQMPKGPVPRNARMPKAPRPRAR